MEKYIVILRNKAKGTLTTELLHAHINHIKRLKQEDVLFLSGPFKNNDGALLIFEANSYKEAEGYLLQDPMIIEKYYEDYDIYELIEANESNNFLMEDVQTKLNLRQ